MAFSLPFSTIGIGWTVVIISAFVIAILWTSIIVKKACISAGFEKIRVKRLQRNTFLFFFLYLSYITLLSGFGVFNQNTLPPLIFVFGTIPLLLFLFLIVWRSNVFNQLLQALELKWLVSFHAIRLMGSFFLLAYWVELLPKTFALQAGWGDVFTAISALAIFIIYPYLKKGQLIVVFSWNCFGLLDIFNVIISAVLITQKAIETTTEGVIHLLDFPFVLIPAFAPATIIFCHAVIFKKIHQLHKLKN